MKKYILSTIVSLLAICNVYSQSANYTNTIKKLEADGYEQQVESDLTYKDKIREKDNWVTLELNYNEPIIVVIENIDGSRNSFDALLYDDYNKYQKWTDYKILNSYPDNQLMYYLYVPTNSQSVKYKIEFAYYNKDKQNILKNTFKVWVGLKPAISHTPKVKKENSNQSTNIDLIKSNLTKMGYRLKGENADYSPEYNDFAIFNFTKKSNEKLCLILYSDLTKEDIGEVVIMDENDNLISSTAYSCDKNFLQSNFLFNNLSGNFKLKITLKSSVRYKLPYMINLLVGTKETQIKNGEFYEVINCE